ncbi:MAG: DNA mismatch repair protein MutT [Clostridiales bacterium]|nr:MAG: DNA mismatch repair protein MutT [Clostridiales bacterium]
MPKLELTNMVMIVNKNDGKVLVQNRIKDWKGISLPGGHIEENESFVDSAVREIKEETGLDIRNLKSCGVIHWLHRHTLDRYIVFLYKTSDYSGDIIYDCKEGQNSWMSIEELKSTPSSNGMPKYLPMFLEDKYNEVFEVWSDDEPWDISFK